MRILQLGKYYPPVQGGMENHLKDLCESLVSENQKVTCFVSSTTSSLSNEQMKGVSVVRFPKLIKNSPPINISLAPTLIRDAKKFDIVHLHMPNPWAEMCTLIARPKNLIVSYHADIINKRGAAIYSLFQKMILRRARVIITSSEVYAKSSPLLKKFTNKCKYIPYGVNFEHLNIFSKANVEKIRRFGSPPFFLFVGRLVPYKGVKFLISSMENVKGTLLIVGNGTLAGELKEQAKKNKASARILFFDKIDTSELSDFYHACDIFVLPSITRAEAFGIVQLEAMYSSKPVINTDLGSGAELVSLHETTGLTVPPCDIPALSKAMNDLGTNTLKRSKYGKNAKIRAEKFTLKTMTRKILDVYLNASKL